jgi:hypothetical protein
MKKVLPIKKQIEIIERVKSNLISYGCERGLCKMFRHSMNGAYFTCQITEQIPSFTRENAFKLSEKYGFTKPHSKADYWWRVGTTKSRLAFVDALLKELKLNLK